MFFGFLRSDKIEAQYPMYCHRKFNNRNEEHKKNVADVERVNCNRITNNARCLWHLQLNSSSGAVSLPVKNTKNKKEISKYRIIIYQAKYWSA